MKQEIINNYIYGNNWLEDSINPPMQKELLGKPLTNTIIEQSIDRLKKRVEFDIEVSYYRPNPNKVIITINSTEEYALTN